MGKSTFSIYTDGKTAILHTPGMGDAPKSPYARTLDGAPEEDAVWGAWATKLYHKHHHYSACVTALRAVYERDWRMLDMFLVGIKGDDDECPLIPFVEGTSLQRLPVEARKSIMLALYRHATVELAHHIYTLHGWAQPAAGDWEHICGVLGIPSWGDAQNLARELDDIVLVRKQSGYGSRTPGWLVDVQRRCQHPDFMDGYRQAWHVQRVLDKAAAKKAA